MGTNSVYTLTATCVALGSLLLAASQDILPQSQVIRGEDIRRQPQRERRSLNDDNKIEVDSNTWLRPLETTLNFSGRRWNVTGSRKVSVGGYSRSYSEKRYQVNRTRHHEKHSNRSVETETRLTFHRMTPGDFYGPFGMHRLTVRNQTFTGPSGESLNAEFSNITYFDGIPEDRGEDNIHPLTYITQKLIKKELVDGGTFMKECILWM